MEGTSMATVFSTAIASVSSDALGMITTALPVALGIAGTIIALRIGWKAFKSFTR